MISYPEIERIRNSDLPHAARYILIELSIRAGRKGFCYPSVAQMAADTGLSRSSVKRHLGLLAERRWIEVERSHHSSNTYYVRPLEAGMPDPPHATVNPPPVQCEPSPVQCEPSPHATVNPPPVQCEPPPVHSGTHEIERKDPWSMKEKEGKDVERVKTFWGERCARDIPTPMVEEALSVASLEEVEDAIKSYASYREMDPLGLVAKIMELRKYDGNGDER